MAGLIIGIIFGSILFIVMLIIIGMLTQKIYSKKGYFGYGGFVAGFFLGAVGLIYAIGLPDKILRDDIHNLLTKQPQANYAASGSTQSATATAPKATAPAPVKQKATTAPTSKSKDKLCPHCNAVINFYSEYCSSCGEKVNKD